MPKEITLEMLYSARGNGERMDGMVCKDCGCDDQTKLRVHHFTYENHGDERHHFDDLITICDECHRFRHSEEANK